MVWALFFSGAVALFFGRIALLSLVMSIASFKEKDKEGAWFGSILCFLCCVVVVLTFFAPGEFADEAKCEAIGGEMYKGKCVEIKELP